MTGAAAITIERPSTTGRVYKKPNEIVSVRVPPLDLSQNNVTSCGIAKAKDFVRNWQGFKFSTNG